jgi:hypothetical protein
MDARDMDHFKNKYGSLTVEELADQVNCTPVVVRQRELAGDLFAVHGLGLDGGAHFPMFQLDDRLDKSLLKEIIMKYREADVNTTLLWSFLRSPQKVFTGCTPMEMMLGATPAAFVVLTPEEWRGFFLDLVDEEISRVR